MSVFIRPYIDSDIPAILDIINYNIEKSTSIYDYNPRILAKQKSIMQAKKENDFPTFVAEIDDKVVGFGTYGHFRYKDGYKFTVEHSVYVAHNYKGRNIGGLLLQILIETAKSQNYHTMIGVVDAENTGSIAFHEKHGFKIVGVLKETGFKFERWLDSVFMQILLEELP